MYIQKLLSGLYAEMKPQNGIQVLYKNILYALSSETMTSTSMMTFMLNLLTQCTN